MQQFLNARIVQAKLAISQPGDAYEREADRVAARVMHGSDARVSSALTSPALQTQAIAGETPGAAMGVIPTGGQPLPEAIRTFFESRLGYDFSGLRIHSDAQATGAARALNARAYTVGRDIVFGAGQYAPHTAAGQGLIAHELAHVMQQGGAGGLVTASANGLPSANFVQRAAAEPVTGTTQQEDECAGWFRDRESTSKRAAEHYVRTELVGDRGRVTRIECDLFDSDTGAFACTVHFSDGTPIRVIVRKDAIIVGVYPLQSFYPPPDRPLCWYDYKCPGPNRDLVLTRRKCQTSQSGTGASPPKAHGPEP